MFVYAYVLKELHWEIKQKNIKRISVFGEDFNGTFISLDYSYSSFSKRID